MGFFYTGAGNRAQYKWEATTTACRHGQGQTRSLRRWVLRPFWLITEGFEIYGQMRSADVSMT
jgi:hypothetical protein